MTTEHTAVRSGKSERKPFNSNVADYLLIIATFGFRDMDFIMHLVQLGFGDGEAMRDELATQSRSL